MGKQQNRRKLWALKKKKKTTICYAMDVLQHICLRTMCLTPEEKRGGCQVTGTGVVSSSVGSGNQTLGPLQEQQVLLTPEPAPKP